MTKRRRFHAEAGLTLPELLVVCFVLVALLAVLQGTFRYQAMQQRRDSATAVTQAKLRLWLDRMVRETRGAAYDPLEVNRATATFTILELSPTSIRFTTDFDADGVLDPVARENVGYRLNGDVLERWQGGANWRPLLTGVTQFALSCLDAKSDPIPCAGTPASVRRSVSAIDVTIAARAETGGGGGVAPATISQTATVELRNEIF